MQAILGLLLILVFSIFLGRQYRRSWNVKVIALLWIVALVMSWIFSKAVSGLSFFVKLNQLVNVLSDSTQKATTFLFGYLAGGKAPFEVIDPSSSMIIVFYVFPIIIFLSALSSLLFHWGIIPFIVNGLTKLIKRVIPLSGPLTFGVILSLFLGTIETPLAIKNYLKKMTPHELLLLMSATLSTIAGTVMVLYAQILGQVLPESLFHMVSASLVSLPVVIALCLTIAPLEDLSDHELPHLSEFRRPSAILAYIEGTVEGLQMVLSIVAILLSFMAGLHLIDFILEALSLPSLATILGQGLKLIVWLLGVSWEESQYLGVVLAKKILINEFVAYIDLSALSKLSEKSKLIMTYAMCGFANLASVGILIGGLQRLLPDRIQEIVKISFKALLIGNLATWTTGAMIGLFS